ncbi:MAG: PfkB family carbohydrate kinase [Acidobacteriota bacterium]
MQSLKRSRVLEILERGSRANLAVIGDFMLDRYLVGEATRISPEAPVPVIRFREETVRLGGAGNVARNLVALGARVNPIGIIGADPDGAVLRGCLETEEIPAGGLLEVPGRMTTVKTRILAGHHPVARLDREDDRPVEEAVASLLLGHCEKALPGLSAFILCDYGKGVWNERTVPALMAMARRGGIPVYVDPKPRQFPLYRGAALVTPNHLEACAAAGWSSFAGENDPERLSQTLLSLLECQAVLITRGKQGMVLCEPGNSPIRLPAFAQEVYDVTGAGDTVIAVASLALLGGGTLQEAAQMANIAAAGAVGKVGTAVVSREEILAALS